MAPVSTVPAVLDAIVALAAAALPGVLVSDGEPLDPSSDDIVVIGFNGTPGDAVVTATLTNEQMAVGDDREQYEIACLASVWRGGQRDAKAVRDRAYELVQTVANALAADSRLGGLVMMAGLSAGEYAPLQTDQGAVATLHFTITVDAFTG